MRVTRENPAGKIFGVSAAASALPLGIIRSPLTDHHAETFSSKILRVVFCLLKLVFYPFDYCVVV